MQPCRNKRSVFACQSWTIRVDLSPRPVPCPCLHLALSHRVRSQLHWSVQATDSVRGDGGQTVLRQTVAIWETTVLYEPASPHHCLPYVRIKRPIFHFCPLEFSWETLEFTVCVMALCSHETQQHNNINITSFSFFPFSSFPLCEGNLLVQHLWRESSSN